MSDPQIAQGIKDALTTIGVAGGAIGTAAASSPVVVGSLGFAGGYAIGYYPGQYTATIRITLL